MTNLTEDDMSFVRSVIHIAKENKQIYDMIHPDHREKLDKILNELGYYCENVVKAEKILEGINSKLMGGHISQEARKAYELIKLAKDE